MYEDQWRENMDYMKLLQTVNYRIYLLTEGLRAIG